MGSYSLYTNLNTLSTQAQGANNCLDILKRRENQNDGRFFFSHSHPHVHSRYATEATVESPNIIAHEKGCEFHVQP